MATPKQIDKLRTAAQVGVTISGATLVPAKEQDGTEAFKMSITELSPFLTDKGLRIGTTGIISGSLQDVKDAAATNTGIKLSNTTFEYTGIFTFASKTASTLIYLNASKQVTSLANSIGFLYNDGTGVLSYAAGTSQWVTSGSDIYYDTGKVQIGINTVGASKLNVYSATGAILKLQTNTSTLDAQISATVGDAYYGISGDAFYFQTLDNLANGIYFWPNTAGVNSLHLLSDGSIRHEYSPSVYVSYTVDSTGVVTIDAVGSNSQIIYNDDVKIGIAGKGLYVKEGSNATMGTAILASGTVVVNTTKVTANSRIFLTVNGGTLTNVGAVYISARTAGTSFTITSLNILDASTVAWVIVEPA